MPRKAAKTEKPSLQFLERALGGARVRNVPEVRAALNPKEFFAEAEEHNRTALQNWVSVLFVFKRLSETLKPILSLEVSSSAHCSRIPVLIVLLSISQVSPQFDTSAVAALPVRRGRRKGQSATSILDGYSQLSRKSSVCKFPSLTFEARSKNQPQPKRTLKKKAPECSDASDKGNQRDGSRTKKTTSAHCSETVRKRNVGGCSGDAASSSRCLDQPGAPSPQMTERPRFPAEGAFTPPHNEPSNTRVTSFGSPPDVDTPKAAQERSSDPHPTFLNLFQPRSFTLPRSQPPDILVADTPERDYGLKVTWRRRRSLLFLLKERGHLSDSDVSIQSTCREQVGQ